MLQYLLIACSWGNSMPRPTDTPPAAGDEVYASVRQAPRQLGRSLVVRVLGLRPRRAEDGDCRTEPCQRVETLDELAGDAQRAPRVRVQEGDVGAWR